MALQKSLHATYYILQLIIRYILHTVKILYAISYYYRDMSFAENVKNELEFQGMQLKELSAKTKISRNTLDKYISGKNAVQPGVENAVKIAKALNVSVEYLVTGKTDTTEKVSSDSLQVLREYNKLNSFNKKTVVDLLNSLSSRQ